MTCKCSWLSQQQQLYMQPTAVMISKKNFSSHELYVDWWSQQMMVLHRCICLHNLCTTLFNQVQTLCLIQPVIATSLVKILTDSMCLHHSLPIEIKLSHISLNQLHMCHHTLNSQIWFGQSSDMLLLLDTQLINSEFLSILITEDIQGIRYCDKRETWQDSNYSLTTYLLSSVAQHKSIIWTEQNSSWSLRNLDSREVT